jgi:dipeptidase E
MNLLLSSDGKTAIQNISKVCSKEDPKIAWIITASKTKENSNFLNLDLQEFIKQGITPHIYDINNKTVDDFLKDFVDFDLIYMEGGNTFYLLNSIRESSFDKFLEEWVVSRPYIGVSAGSYVICPTIEMATWKHADRDRHGLTYLAGLNFIDFLVTAHYDEKYKESIKRGKENTEYPLWIIKDGQALLIQNNTVTLLGDQEVIHI